MAVRVDLTFDCTDATRLAEFWKLALGYIDEPAPAPFANREEWLRHHGVAEDEWGDGAWLCDPAGAGPRLSILAVPEGKLREPRTSYSTVTCGNGIDLRHWLAV